MATAYPKSPKAFLHVLNSPKERPRSIILKSTKCNSRLINKGIENKEKLFGNFENAFDPEILRREKLKTSLQLPKKGTNHYNAELLNSFDFMKWKPVNNKVLKFNNKD